MTSYQRTIINIATIALLCTGKTMAQQIIVSDALTIRNDYGYEIIGRLRDKILLLRDKYDEFEVQAYDAQMQMAWNKELTDMGKSGVQIVTVISGKNDFSVIYKLRRRGRTSLRIHKYDPGANIIDSMTLKDYGERLFTPPSLDFVRSDDRKVLAVFNKAERDKVEITCFRLDKMQVLWDKDVQVKIENDVSYENFNFSLTNDGQLHFIREKNNQRSKIENHHFEILTIDQQDEYIRRVKLPPLFTCDVSFTYDNINKKLVGAGVYGEKNKDRANGSYFISISGADTTAQIKYEEFDAKFISILRQKDVEDDSKGIGDNTVSSLISRQDGGVILMVERNHEIQRGAAAGRGFLRDGMRMIIDFYFDDVYAIAYYPDGNVHWKTVLHKKQYSQDDDATFSSYFLFKSPEKLRMLFNDEIKYENTCSEYLLSPVGEFDRNSLINTFDQGLRLRFKDGAQISANECIIPSEWRNRLKLVLVRY